MLEHALLDSRFLQRLADYYALRFSLIGGPADFRKVCRMCLVVYWVGNLFDLRAQMVDHVFKLWDNPLSASVVDLLQAEFRLVFAFLLVVVRRHLLNSLRDDHVHLFDFVLEVSF